MASSKSKALLAVCALVMLAAAMQAYGLRAVLQSKHPDNLSGCSRCIRTLRMSHYAEAVGGRWYWKCTAPMLFKHVWGR